MYDTSKLVHSRHILTSKDTYSVLEHVNYSILRSIVIIVSDYCYTKKLYDSPPHLVFFSQPSYSFTSPPPPPRHN